LQGYQADVDIKFRKTFPASNECAEPIFLTIVKVALSTDENRLLK